MDIYTTKGGLKKLIKDFDKDDIAKLYIAELRKNKELIKTTLNAFSNEENNVLPINNSENKGNNTVCQETINEIPGMGENNVLQVSLTQEVGHKSDDHDIEEHEFRKDIPIHNIVRDLPVTERNRQFQANQKELNLPENTNILINMQEKIYNLEKRCAANDQYSRRNSIEISGIPDSIPDNLLEGKVIEILSYLNIDLDNCDIEACHRLYKKPNSLSPARVIVRFLNRKNTYLALSRKKSLSNIKLKSDGTNNHNNRIYINENLCPAYREIYNFAYSLLKNNEISHLWTFKGVVHLRDSDNNNDNVMSFTHIDDIKSNFM